MVYKRARVRVPLRANFLRNFYSVITYANFCTFFENDLRELETSFSFLLIVFVKMFVQVTAYNSHCYHYFVIFQGILLFSLIKYTRVKYEDYVYPLWGEVLGWLITAVSMLLVPVFIVKTVVDIYCRGKGGADAAEVRESFEYCLKSFVSRFVLCNSLVQEVFYFLSFASNNIEPRSGDNEPRFEQRIEERRGEERRRGEREEKPCN